MNEKKLTRTPDIDSTMVTHIGDVMVFKLPSPAHLTVGELGKLPCAKKFPSAVRFYLWEPEEVKWYADHAHVQGVELFVCFEGTVEVWLHDGTKEAIVVLKRGDALFIPTLVWHRVRPGEQGGKLLVLSDVPYDRELHYTEDFETFLQETAYERESTKMW